MTYPELYLTGETQPAAVRLGRLSKPFLLHQQKAEAVRFFFISFHDLKPITHLPGRGINIHPEGFQGGARHQRVPAFGLGVLALFAQIAWGRRKGKGLVKSREENFSLQSENLFVDFS